MSSPLRIRAAWSLLIAAAVAGCWQGNKSLHYLGDADLKYYKHAATQVDYPHIHSHTPEEVKYSDEPRVVGDRRKDEVWNVTLMESLQTALANNRIIRSNSQFLSTGNSLLNNAQFTPSVYDPAIQESGVLFGGLGVEAALANFDAQFTTTMLWGRDESLQNNAFTGQGITPGATQVLETGIFTSQIEKQFAYGGSFRVAHDWNYIGTNSPAALFKSSFVGNVRGEYRQPLLAGAGAEFTRIAGPLNPGFRGITGVSQGVVIARINNDITVADFELAVRNLLKDVEDLYWELYLQYRLYDTAITARNGALRSWREAQAKLEVGGAPNFKPADEAQARDQYFQFRAAAESTLAGIYATELRFRRLLGLSVNDGRIIRPSDEPTTAPFHPDWYTALTEALTQRAELRKQKFNIRSLELQRRAAESLTQPRLDFVSSYRVNALGDRLFGEEDSDGVTAQGLRSAYETLTQGNQTGWNLGFEFSLPFGFRSALAQVRNIELRLSKAREALAVQELEISHELASAMQELATEYVTAQSNFNRLRAAEERVRLFQAEFDAGTATLDLVLRAQTSLAEAERDFYTSLVDYNRAIAEFQFRKGTLIEHNNVFLAEGEWTPQAYREALRRAWARSHALSNPLLHAEPEEFILPDGAPQTIELGPAPHEAHLLEPGQPESEAAEPTQQAPTPELIPGAPDLPEPSAADGSENGAVPIPEDDALRAAPPPPPPEPTEPQASSWTPLGDGQSGATSFHLLEPSR